MRHDDRLRARDHRHAVVARQRIGDHRRGEILLHGQRRAIDRVRIFRRPCALRDGDVAVVGFLQAVFLHLAAGDQRIDAVRPAVAERRQMLLRRGVVVRRDLGVAGEAGGIAAEHEDRRRPRRSRRARSAWPSMFIADEPPLVSCTSQRSDRPSFQARSTAASGASENDATAMPWMSLARRGRASFERRHHRVAHEMQRGLARLRTPRVGRLADADDGGVVEHALSSLQRRSDVSVHGAGNEVTVRRRRPT